MLRFFDACRAADEKDADDHNDGLADRPDADDGVPDKREPKLKQRR